MNHVIWNRITPFLFWTLFSETFSECFDHSTLIFFISVLRLLHFYDYVSHYQKISVILIDEDIFSLMKFERKLYRRHQVLLSSSSVSEIFKVLMKGNRSNVFQMKWRVLPWISVPCICLLSGLNKSANVSIQPLY